MSTLASTRPEIELPRGVSETFTDEAPGTATTQRYIQVPSSRPTPLIGTWADESWPLNSRQASEIITEQVLQAQRSSCIFEDDEGNVLMAGDDETDEFNSDVDGVTCDESMMQEAMSHAQISTEEVTTESQMDIDSPTHVAQSFRYDPYHISNAQIVLHRCTCECCVPMLHQKYHQEALLKQLSCPVLPQESASNQVSPAAPKAVDVASPLRSAQMFLAAPPECVTEHQEDQDWDLPTYKPTSSGQPQHMNNAAPAPQFHQFPSGPNQAGNNGGGFMTHTQLSSPPMMDMNTPTPSPGNMMVTPGSNVSGLSHPPPTQRRMVAPGEAPVAQPREVSTYMPPPPPPRIACMVYEEEGTIKNPSGIYYHLLMRWYSKVQESQEYFLTSEDLCPSPNKDKFSFEDWADQISGWWYTNFEHMQKKGPRFARRH